MKWYNPAEVGRATRQLMVDFGYGFRMLLRLLWLLAPCVRRFGLLRDQIFFLGNYSLSIIGVSGLFVGFVMGLQIYYLLQRFGSSDAMGLVVAIAMLRELGPVVAALLFAGRAGTSLTAEIGLMKSGEQISAMEMMAVDPVQRVLAPRFWGGIVALPLLTCVFNTLAIWGSYLVAVVMLGADGGAFWGQMQSGVDIWVDLGNSVVKSVVFGVTVSFIAVYQGYEAQATPEGVSRATTRTVVLSSLAVLALDFIMTAMMFSF